MAEPVESSQPGLEAEEARLARAAASGDGEAFATLYERYSQRAYNLSVRLCGSDQDAADAVQEAFLSVMRRLPEFGADRELAFGSYLFTATRNATYDLIRLQQRSQPSDSISESATPLGAGAGGMGLDPGDPGEDPDRNVLLEAQQEEVAAANARLPERQREALALRELEEMSYDEIAAVMAMNRNSVAQLISRARINLRDELRGTALASVAVSSPDCERALPLIAALDDGQLAAGSADAAWLASHMSGCSTCQVASEAMQEAGVSYRAWIPVAVAPWVFKETMAKAAELSGSDWSEVAERHRARTAEAGQFPGMPAAYAAAAREANGQEEGSRRRRAMLVGVLALLLLLGGAVVALSAGGGEEPKPEPARFEFENSVLEPVAEPEPNPKPQPVEKKKQKPQPSEKQAASAEPEPLPVTEAAAPSAAPPAESKTKTKTPPAAQPQGGEAGLGGSSTRDPKPESTPPSEQPPSETPPPAGEEPEPVPPPPPPKPPKKGPGDLTSPPGPPKPG